MINTQVVKPIKHCATCNIYSRIMKTCSGCQNIYYCSEDCQRKNWSNHKNYCGKNCEQPKCIKNNFKDAMIWFDNLLKLSQYRRWKITSRNEFIIITIKNINELTCDINKINKLCDKIVTKSNINQLYPILKTLSAAKDYQCIIDKYNRNRKKYVLVFIVVVVGDSCINILRIAER
ncbi:hypothetical protein QLL95_gp0434 [Cotonvirus japonicus]|uniref:MYND-type domain-containing protein n=1 Tax=Cotonvirus japonicus TaxID=2811091 RepID=A0ABM7NU80_9VIRU|nr:hypothetical protein QLL95_gp0434 [Cotonvirus japonicus]BCS83689.1 hypothetical protein [Cotonvirus japonicus]